LNKGENHLYFLFGGGKLYHKTQIQEMISDRVEKEVELILNKKMTIRQTAKIVGVSKSSVARDISVKLPETHPLLVSQVRDVINENKANAPMRGGLATRKRWKELTGYGKKEFWDEIIQRRQESCQI
jgi:putative DeoR family transcriptional regulator (stage III sporulation protein D)